MADLLQREFKMSARVADEATREVEFVGATETPVNMGYGPPEVLRIEGADYEKSVPFLNCHQRWTVLDVLGRAFPKKDKRTLVFRVKFSNATEQARAAFELVKEGAIDAVSVGYSVEEFREILAGQFDGRGENRIEGPAIIATKWRVRELSLVPIGADPNARKRSADEVEARKRAYESAKKEDPVKIKPNPGETREQFTARALVDAELVAEFPDETKRRTAIDAAWSAAQPKAPAAPAGSVPPTSAPPAPPAPARSVDAELAEDLEARKKLILTRCPQDLRAYLDGLLLDRPLITPDEAWKELREERARRLQPGGTPEPKRPGASPQAKPEPAPSTSTPAEERNDLGRLLREVRS